VPLRAEPFCRSRQALRPRRTGRVQREPGQAPLRRVRARRPARAGPT